MKLFKTNDIRLVHLCQDLFHFHLPSLLLQQGTKKSWTKYKIGRCASEEVILQLIPILLYGLEVLPMQK